MPADVALLTSQRLARLEIEPVSALKPVVPEPLVERIVVDGHSARAQDLRDVASDQQRSRILKAKSKQLGMLIEDIDQLPFALGRGQVGVYRHAAKETKARLVSSRHQHGLVWPTAHDERTLNDSPSRISTNTPLRLKTPWSSRATGVPRNNEARRPALP